MYYLGWLFFRDTPWGLPLGASPNYGAELGSSIAFADNVPLFDFVFKILRYGLPTPFQYFGIWTLLCFILQAWFASLLIGLISPSRLARCLGAALFVFAPPFLWRLQGHYQLEGQWLILAAMYLSFGPRRLARGVYWPLLGLVASLVHTYLTAMVLSLWLGDLARRMIFERRIRADLSQLCVVPALVLLGSWQAGLLMVNGITTDGFGYYRMNVDSLIDPSGWSYLLPDLPEGGGDYEGFCYLGAGLLLTAALALPALRTLAREVRNKREYWPLGFVLLCLTAFALSNRPGIGAHTLDSALPQTCIDVANVLRAGGRLFWPVFYCLTWIFVRALLNRYSQRRATLMLLGAALIQAFDTSAGWRPIRQTLMVAGAAWSSPLRSGFWKKVPGRYREIRFLPPRNQARSYEDFAYFAGTHGMATDAVYLARLDQGKLKRARRAAAQLVKNGKYTPATLYVILDPSYERAARTSLNVESDLLTRVDGFDILAPGWRCRPECAVDAAAEDCSRSCGSRRETGP